MWPSCFCVGCPALPLHLPDLTSLLSCHFPPAFLAHPSSHSSLLLLSSASPQAFCAALSQGVTLTSWLWCCRLRAASSGFGLNTFTVLDDSFSHLTWFVSFQLCAYQFNIVLVPLLHSWHLRQCLAQVVFWMTGWVNDWGKFSWYWIFSLLSEEVSWMLCAILYDLLDV